MQASNRVRNRLAVVLAGMLLAGGSWLAVHAAGPQKSEFARTTIDIGVVVSDVNRAVKFYTEVIGFKEIQGFSVDADFCTSAGLTDHKKLDIRVLVLGDEASATRLKLMEVPSADSKKSDNTFIHSQLGFSYLTVYVADGNQALERLGRAGVRPLAKGPVPLPADQTPGLALAVVRDPDGNLIELIGPVR
jgi:catechol 2,3-dioxygenase-like lactoylglutathione lyase family enzyme